MHTIVFDKEHFQSIILGVASAQKSTYLPEYQMKSLKTNNTVEYQVKYHKSTKCQVLQKVCTKVQENQVK